MTKKSTGGIIITILGILGISYAVFQSSNQNKNIVVSRIGNTDSKAFITSISNRWFLNFFNSKEVFSIRGFDSERKAKNYAKKWSIVLYDKKPNGIKDFEYWD